ncbi:16395_t:CDS:2, partial [Racocetra fulgida]
FLSPEILSIQYDEINQSLYYVAYLVSKKDVLFSDDLDAILSNNENKSVDDPQATIRQLLGIVDFDDRMNKLEQRFIYGHLHGAYKVALQKALPSKLKSQHLIKILQEFADENDEYNEEPSDEECDQYDSLSDKKNAEIILQNPKK